MQFWGSFGNQLLFSLLLILGLHVHYVHPSALGLEKVPKARGVRPPSPPKKGSILGPERNYTLYSTYGNAYDVAKRCSQGDQNPGVLVPLPLISWVLQDILSANRTGISEDLLNITQNLNHLSMWVLDPWGGCRSATLSMDSTGSTADLVELKQESCSLEKNAICVSYDVVQNDLYPQKALTVYNRYWTPEAPAEPPAVPAKSRTSTAAPAGYQLVEGMVLGRQHGSNFTGYNDFYKFGPVVNLVTRWKSDGLSELACVYAQEEVDEEEELLDIEPGLVGFPLIREDSNQNELRISYIVRVEGCVGPTSIQRLAVTTAIGASYAMGTGQCIANFLEEAPPGGYLAHLNWTRGPELDPSMAFSSPPPDASPPLPTSTSSQRVIKLQMVWAVPLNSISNTSTSAGANALRQVFPRLKPVVPKPDCSEARTILPPNVSISSNDSSDNTTPCGSSYACPSYMCCVLNPGSGQGRCVATPALCKTQNCTSSYGLCEQGVWRKALFAVHEGTPVLNVSTPVWPPTPPSPSVSSSGVFLSVDTAPVRNATVVYAMRRAAVGMDYQNAVNFCSAVNYLGLTWGIIDIADALAFENSLLLSENFINMLNGVVKGVWLSWRGTGNCVRAKWKVADGKVQLSSLRLSKGLESASVICRATWPGLTGYTVNVSDGQEAATNSSMDGRRPPAVRFTPGSHSLSVSHVGDNVGLSGASCKATSVCSLHSVEDVAKALSRTLWGLDVARSPVPLQDPPLDLNSPMAAIALRPLTAWSTVDKHIVTYDTVAALAIQYYSPMLPTSSLPTGAPETFNFNNQTLAAVEPFILGSEDGTIEGADRRRAAAEYLSYESAWRKRTLLSDRTNDMDDDNWGRALSDYLSYDAGWRILPLNVSAGEVVEEVSGCRGGLVEQLVLRTSAGRLLSGPAGPGFMCSVPFRLTAPAGGYLVAVQVLAGSYLEELQVVWGTPLRRIPPAVQQHRNPDSLPSPEFRPSPVADPPSDAFEMEPPPPRFLTPGMPGSASASPAPTIEDDEPTPVDEDETSEGELSPPNRNPEDPKHTSPLPTQQQQQQPSGGGTPPSATSSKLGVGAGVGVGLGVSAAAVLTVWMAVWVVKRRGQCGGSGGGGGGGAGNGGGGGGARKEATGTGRRRGGEGDLGGRGRGNWDAFSALPFEAAGRLSSTSSGGVAGGGGGGRDAAVGMAPSSVVVDIAKPASGTSPRANKMAPAPSITPSLGDSMGSSGPGAAPGLPRFSPERTSRSRSPAPPPYSSSAFAAPANAAAADGAGDGTAAAARAPPAAAEGALAGEPSTLGSVTGTGFGRPVTGGSLEQQMHAALFQKALYIAQPYVRWEGAGGKPGNPYHDPSSVLGAGAATGTGTSTSTISATALSRTAGPTTLNSATPRPGLGRLSGGTSLGATSSTVAGAVNNDVGMEEGGVSKQSQGQQGQHKHQQQAQLLRTLANAAAAMASATGGGDAGPTEADGGGGVDGMREAAAHGGGGAGALSVPTHGSLSQFSGSGAAGGGGTAELLLGRDVIVNVDDPATYLGHGTSGVVRRGTLRQPDGSWRPVAVKLLNTPPGETAADWYNRHLRTLVQEVTILGSLCHPNIVQLLGGCLNPGASFLVEELCGGTLSHAIYGGGAVQHWGRSALSGASSSYDVPQLLRWSADIAAGLAFLHPHIMHRDLKPSNVLLDETGTAKISDFGLARFKAHTTLHTKDAEVGTTCYMAPECFVSTDVKVTAACDVYSLGVLINEMATRARPWAGTRTAVVGFKVAVVGERPELPHPDCELCPPALRQLITDCWAQQPSDRPTSAQVLARLGDLLAQVEAGAGPIGAERKGQEPNQRGCRPGEREETNGPEGASERPSREQEGLQRQGTRPSASGGGPEGMMVSGTAGKEQVGSQELEGGRSTDWPEGSPAAAAAARGGEERSGGHR